MDIGEDGAPDAAIASDDDTQDVRASVTGMNGKLLVPMAAAVAAGLLASGCLNTQSVAFEEQPAELASPEAACRSAAEADGHTVIDITDLREVSGGYWEARFVLEDPELRNLLGCRHNTRQGFTEVVRLDE